MGAWLIPVQIAFSLVIVTMAALMGGTVARLLAVDPGFRTSGITLLHADFSPRLPKTENKPASPPTALLLSLLDRIAAHAGRGGREHLAGVPTGRLQLSGKRVFPSGFRAERARMTA